MNNNNTTRLDSNLHKLNNLKFEPSPINYSNNSSSNSVRLSNRIQIFYKLKSSSSQTISLIYTQRPRPYTPSYLRGQYQGVLDAKVQNDFFGYRFTNFILVYQVNHL